MQKIKTFLINFIWNGNNIIEFEKWVYKQNSIEFEKLIGEDNFIELVTYNYKNKSLENVKKFIKSVLKENIISEFENEFLKKRKVIKGICIKNEALDYVGNAIKKWNVEIGKEYEFIAIRTNILNDNHKGYANYIDREYNFKPSGFLPISLFDFENLSAFSDVYTTIKERNSEIYIEPYEFTKQKYIPTEYSFWEDFYNDDEKALKTYDKVLEELGVKKVW